VAPTPLTGSKPYEPPRPPNVWKFDFTAPTIKEAQDYYHAIIEHRAPIRCRCTDSSPFGDPEVPVLFELAAHD